MVCRNIGTWSRACFKNIHNPQACNEELFKIAQSVRCPERTMDFIVEQWLKHHCPEKFVFGKVKHSSPDLPHVRHLVSEACAKGLSKIVPHLKLFVCLSVEGYETQEAFTTLLKALALAKNLQGVALVIPPSSVLMGNEARLAMKEMLARTPLLKLVNFVFKPGSATTETRLDDLVIETMAEGFAGRQAPILQLRLTGCHIQDGSGLVTIMKSPKCPRSMNISKLKWKNEPSWSEMTACPGSTLECIKIEQDSAHGATQSVIASILDQATQLPCLKSLTLMVYSSWTLDVSRQVCTLLGPPSQLQCLQLSSPLQANLPAVCTLLEDNETLLQLLLEPIEHGEAAFDCMLQVLKGANTSLFQYHAAASHDPIYEKIPAWHSIYHYTQLNQLGRKAARDPATPKEHPVHLLSEVSSKSTSESKSILFLYELLHENPFCWSTL